MASGAALGPGRTPEVEPPRPRLASPCPSVQFARRAGEARERAGKQPNILVIMGDDVGWFNIGAYHRGIMSGKTPNLDKLAAQGMMFTDYYAEASCTAGRANFITGEIPLRTGTDDGGPGRRRRGHAGPGVHDRPPR